MLTINILEFIDYDKSALKEYLVIHNETDFKINIRKEFVNENTNISSSEDYKHT